MVTDAFEGNLQSMMIRSGTDVIYQPFVANPANATANTKEVIDEEAAYPSTAHQTIKALIELAPSQAMRLKLGLSEDVAAVLTVTQFDINRLALTITTKDRFRLPGYDKPFYVDKITPTMQSRGRWFAQLIALTKKQGGLRNR